MTTFYTANYDTKNGTVCGTITALTSNKKSHIRNRLWALGINATRIYNIKEQFPTTAHRTAVQPRNKAEQPNTHGTKTAVRTANKAI